jgi:hypothetical protein
MKMTQELENKPACKPEFKSQFYDAAKENEK